MLLGSCDQAKTIAALQLTGEPSFVFIHVHVSWSTGGTSSCTVDSRHRPTSWGILKIQNRDHTTFDQRAFASSQEVNLHFLVISVEKRKRYSATKFWLNINDTGLVTSRNTNHAMPRGGTRPCSSFGCDPNLQDTLNRILTAFPFPISTPLSFNSCCTPLRCKGGMMRPDWGRSCKVQA